MVVYNPAPMANLESIVQQLRAERDKIDAAIRALTSLGQGSRAATKRSGGVTGPKRKTLSAAARRRISIAQKARWARVKAGKK